MEATLDTLSPPIPTTNRTRWAGRILSGIPVLFLLMDASMKVANPSFVSEASVRMGLPAHLAPGLGYLLFACLALYLVRRTAVLGAALLTGFLGGAVAIHLRIGDPLLSHTLFPVYVGAMLWAGLYLRDPRVRALVGKSG